MLPIEIAPQHVVDAIVETPAEHGEIKTFELTDITDRCRFLVSHRRFDVENDWVNSVWAIKRAFGESGWPVATLVSDADFTNRLQSVWKREGGSKGKPITCATLIEWSNALGYREWKREHMFDGVPVPSVQSPPTAPVKPETQNAATLLTRDFAPVRYIVPGYLAEGCTILAGKPKIGKSWFVLDAGIAVAGGNSGIMFGRKVEAGNVLYLALEDNERRLKSRIKKVIGPFEAGPDRFEYRTEWKRADEGGLDDILAWIKSVPKATLIVVDVLARFRPLSAGRNTAAYDADYAAISGLQGLASRHNVAIVIVHHLRKNAADSDPFDKVSGTLGLSGAADSILILDRDGQGVTLYGRGRDIEEIETAVQFDKGRCRWTALGAAQEVHQSGERKTILNALRDAKGPMTRADIVDATGMKSPNVGYLLSSMVKAGTLTREGKGYIPVDPANSANALTPLTSLTPLMASQPVILSPPPY